MARLSLQPSRGCLDGDCPQVTAWLGHYLLPVLPPLSLFTDPLFSLQSPSSAPDKKYKPGEIY